MERLYMIYTVAKWTAVVTLLLAAIGYAGYIETT